MSKITFLSIALIISLLGNVYLISRPLPTVSENNLAKLQSQFPLLANRALQPVHKDIINNFLPLRQEIDQKIGPYEDEFALYFEYLPTGVSIGVNEDAEFTPASLLKVPVVMAYMHKKERLGNKTDPMVTITQKEVDDHFGELYKKGAGAPISLGDAVKYALQQSDNTASFVLADYIDDTDYAYVEEGLDIPLSLEGKTPIITAQQYTSILKALYFASILNRDNSQYVLDLLTKTDFNQMLPSGIPSNIRVAHKIGLIDDQIYNDCGIVYVPNRPYTICMISKSDSATARKRMQDVSKTIYNYVANYKIPTPVN